MRDIMKLRFPLICLLLMSLLSLTFIGLTFDAKYLYVPDPEPQAGRNYHALNVKVLNVAHTNANDNYVPYRQAQFFVNRLDPARDSFIDEWGVSFFQRTPLMGAVTATYFNILDDKPPVDYSWSQTAQDPSITYVKFQIIAQILNALFIVPAFFLLTKLFDKKTAMISSLFLVTSSFFLYNAFFSWPKSFVAFFVLIAWLLLLENRKSYTYMAALAGGLAYLTHDLAVIYVGATVVLLLYNKRIKDAVIFASAPLLAIILWVGTSSIIYHRPSTFIYYPFSIEGIPQTNKGIFHQFFHTSAIRLLSIRGDSLYFLLSPYQLIYHESGQELSRRLWAVGIFTLPGAVGAGLVIPTLLGAFKRLVTKNLVILILVPLLLCVIIIGWPQGLGAFHFAEAIVVLLTGLGAFYLTKLKNALWTTLAFILHSVQLIFFIMFSYDFHTAVWLHHASDFLRLIVIGIIIIMAGFGIYLISHNKKTSLAA